MQNKMPVSLPPTDLKFFNLIFQNSGILIPETIVQGSAITKNFKKLVLRS